MARERIVRDTLLLAGALALVGYRFAHLDLAAFARDEPQFLAAARAQLGRGHWLSANPLYGNLGLRYGPAAFWFYGVVEALFGDSPRVAIVAMGVLVTLAQLALALALTRMLDEDATFLAVLVAWLASSPYEFLWSRLAWDLTSNAAVFAAAALLSSARVRQSGHAVLLGAVLGLGLATHPSVAPMAVATLAAVAGDGRSKGARTGRALALMIASIVFVNLPYLLFVARAPVVGRAPRLPVSAREVGALLLQAPRIATTWRISYYFEGAWPDFRSSLAGFTTAFDVVSVAGLVVATVGAIGGIALSLRSADERARRMGRAALLAWVGAVALLALVRLPSHPHYHVSAAWVPVFGVAVCLHWLRRRHPRLGAAALALVALAATCQFVTIVRWMGFVRDEAGTRSPSYGTPLGAEIEAVRALCAGPEPRVVVHNETTLFRFPIEYLATTEAACQGKDVLVCAEEPSPFARECPPPSAGTRLARLHFARDRGGALAVDGVATPRSSPR